MIKEFKPTQDSEYFDEASIIQLIEKGELSKAMKICNKNKLSIKKYSQYFEKGVNRLILSHRTSELLSFIFNYPDILQVNKIEILKTTITHRDYHGFLKNCHRFKIHTELKSEIDLALSKLRPEEAIAWSNKFNKM
jgi:hypothetical protein